MGQLGGILWVYFKALIFHDWPWNGPGLTDWIFWVAWWMSYKFSVWLREIPGLLWGIMLGSRSSQEGNWGLQGVFRRYPHYLCHKFGPKFGDSVTKICTCDSPNGLFCKSKHSAHIWHLNASRKPGIVCPLFAFSNKLHYRYKLDTYKYTFCHIREPYLAMLCLSGLFSVPASTAHISCVFAALKSKPGHCGLTAHFFYKIYCKCKLDEYIYTFCNVQVP